MLTMKIALPSGTFHCAVEGKAGAPWIVASNSLATNLSLWDAFAQSAADRYRVFRYDQRGHGGSSAGKPPYAMADLARDALALMDEVGISKAHWIGISMGGATGWGIAQSAPERLLSATLCNTVINATAAGDWEERLALVRKQGLQVLVEPTLERWFTKKSVADKARCVDLVRRMIETTSVDGFTGCANALQTFDFSRDLESIRVPMLLVAGAEDGNKPQTMAADAKRVPVARLAIVPEAGHLCNIENPAAFNRIVGDFIDAAQAASAAPAGLR
jgi:3-oxoadipate enol-lactonase